MVFHSYAFIFGALPACYLGFLLAHRLGGWQAAFAFLAVASVAFYAQWAVTLAAVLMASVIANYLAGEMIMRLSNTPRAAGVALIAAISANIGALGYFKYTNFFIEIANQVAGSSIPHVFLLVPIGVSFFTFIQIGYLIEAYNGQVEGPGFVRYVLFATFLPCVTAGPLVLQREMFDQMKNRTDRAFDATRLATGGTLFAIGLFKKVVLADAIAPFATTVFDGVAAGHGIAPVTAWVGSICYALQLYFDFSGYSDMAIGLGCIFGLMLPLNFYSPFKATSIAEFWRRWHMTMTRFFTTYVYTPLAMRGMRGAMARGHGPGARFFVTAGLPVMATFFVAGIWHGAGWTFVVYGLIHGTAIAINLAWREMGLPKIPTVLAWGLTMAVVVSGLVVFRAANLSTAGTLLASMWSMGLIALPPTEAALLAIDMKTAGSMIVVLGSIVLLMPNSQQILHTYWPSIDSKPESAGAQAGLVVWKPTLARSISIAAVAVVALASIGSTTTFLYYQF